MGSTTRVFLALAVIVVSNASRVGADGVSQGQTSALVERQWNVDGVIRTALIHLSTKAANSATPVVFAFHGRGGNIGPFAERFAVHELWPEAIVVYPQGLPSAIRYEAAGVKPWTGPQILVKESARDGWRVDMSFPKAIRIDAMTVATFTTDGSKRKVIPAVSLLIASPSSKDTTTWTRDDATGQWTQSVVQKGLRGGLRSFCVHTDSHSGVPYLFAGSATYAGGPSAGSIFRHAQMSSGRSNPNDQRIGNGLYVSDGAWDAFRDLSAAMGIQNEEAYNRQPTFGDVNRDGWLDIAVGCDNIKDAQGGVPHSRLYIFHASGERFEDGHFEDIGSTSLVPDFGGFYHDSAKDKSGPDINLVDLDNDGDLDLLQSCHVDVLDPTSPYSPAEYRQGIFCWKNLLVETGSLQFEKVTDNGLACEARLHWNAETQSYDADGKAPGLPYVSLADVDNDGLMDVLAVGPASPGWAPRAEYVSGRFWYNEGDFQFREATDAAGLSALNNTYRGWMKFFDAPSPRRPSGARIDPLDRRPYFADAVFGDFNNDGWIDLVVLDRHESLNIAARAILFMNRGDGTFEPETTEFSGLDASGISGEAADLNEDGLLDLVIASDPDNSGIALSMDRYESKVYWNTGLQGAKDNHWLRIRFDNSSPAALIGARVEVRDPEAGNLLGTRWIHSNQSYKSSGALEAHFGLGKATRADVIVTFLDGRTKAFAALAADKNYTLSLTKP